MDASGADFSDRANKQKNPGYASTFEFAVETPSQRIHRILLELDEIATLTTGVDGEKPAADIVKEVEKVRQKIDSLISSSGNKSLPQASKISELTRVIESNKSSDSAPTYRLFQKPDVEKQYQANKAAEMDKRLSRLEGLLGMVQAKDANAVGLVGKDTLINQLSELETKLSLLDPAKVDLVDARLATVMARLEAVSKSGQGKTSLVEDGKLEKLISLYEVLSKDSEIMQTIPQVVDRLSSLNELHNQAMQTVDAMSFIEKRQSEMDTRIESVQNMLSGVQKSMELCSKDISSYCQRIEAKVAKK